MEAILAEVLGPVHRLIGMRKQAVQVGKAFMVDSNAEACGNVDKTQRRNGDILLISLVLVTDAHRGWRNHAEGIVHFRRMLLQCRRNNGCFGAGCQSCET